MKEVDYQIFISYKSGPDARVAKRLYIDLTKQGYVVFWDESRLQRGDKFNEVIEKAINSSRVFVLLLSHNVLKAFDKSDRNNEDAPYLIKEVGFALKWFDERKKILTYIIDNSNPNDFGKVLPELRKNIDIGDNNFPVDQICNSICNHLDSMPVYPLDDKKEKVRFNIQKGIAERLHSIPGKIKEIITDCSNCPRCNSNQRGIRCPFIHEIDDPSDKEYFEQESILRTEANLNSYKVNKPTHQEWADYSILKEMESAWESDRFAHCYISPEEVRSEFENKYGNNHVFPSKDEPCKQQRLKLCAIEKDLEVFSKPIFQRDLLEFHSAVITIEHTLTNVERVIKKKMGLDTYIEFIKQQLNRIWQFKYEILNIVTHENGYDSFNVFLLDCLKKARIALDQAIKQGASVSKENNSLFENIWWFLRDNSNILLHKLCLELPYESITPLLKELKSFCRLYDSLKKQDSLIYFEEVLPYYEIDYPEEESIKSKGIEPSSYKWATLNEWKEPLYTYGPHDSVEENGYTNGSFLLDSDLDAFYNPVSSEAGLCRGIRHTIFSRPFIIQRRVLAINHLYPISRYCDKLKECIEKSIWEDNLRFIPVELKREYYDFNFNKPEIDDEVLDYQAILFPETEFGDKFNQALKLICDGNLDKAIKKMNSLVNQKDLESIVYMANYFSSQKARISDAIPLYEIASQQGVEFCYSRLALCYEKLGDFRSAFRWYIISNEDGITDVNIRRGVCAYHLKMFQESVQYLSRAGEKGQAAIYILGLYGSKLTKKAEAFVDDNDLEQEDYSQLCKALNSSIKQADTILSDSHQIYYESYGSCVGRREIDIESIEREAKANQLDAQYLLGLLKMEEYIASDDFIEKALGWIKIAANNGDPKALCLLGRYMQNNRGKFREGELLLKKALRAYYPIPFPDIVQP